MRHQNKRNQITVRTTEAERMELKLKATDNGESMSEFILRLKDDDSLILKVVQGLETQNNILTGANNPMSTNGSLEYALNLINANLEMLRSLPKGTLPEFDSEATVLTAMRRADKIKKFKL